MTESSAIGRQTCKETIAHLFNSWPKTETKGTHS